MFYSLDFRSNLIVNIFAFNLKFLLVLLCFLTNFIFADDLSLKKILASKKLTVCTEAGFMPWEFRDNKHNFYGFDYDMMKDFARYLKVTLEMVDMKFDGLVPSLNSGKCHMIAAGLTKTKKRQDAILFSKTIYFDNIAIAEIRTPKKKGPKKLKNLTIEDFDKKGVVIGTRLGSAGDIYLNSLKIKNAKILRYDFQESELVSALLLKKVNIIVYDDLFLKIANKKHKNKLTVYKQSEAAEIAVAASKKSPALIKEFNKFLEDWKKDGRYEKFKKYYFEDLTWMKYFKS